MLHLPRTRALSVLILVVLLITACGQPPGDALREGQLFPSLQLRGFDRPDIRIDDLRGHWVVMNVWATWCGPCRQELDGLQQLTRRFPESKLQVIGLNVDADIHVAREFMRDQAISFANYSDPDMGIAKTLLGIRAFPDTFIIAPDGTLWRSISGERDWASERVINALAEAIAGRPGALATL
jgi:peroxiredoxin